MSDYKIENEELTHCLLQTAQGDKLAFEKIYKLTSPKFHSIIRAMIKDDALTFDILQQAYLAIWKKAHTYDPDKGKAFTWMLVITRNKALDMLRKRQRFIFTEELSDTLEDETVQTDIDAESLLLRRLVTPHLQSLSSDVRQAILMSVIGGMTSREIGEKIGVPTNTVKSWVRRGLAKLRREIDIQDIKAIL